MAVALPLIAAIRSIHTAVGWFWIEAGAPEAAALARHIALLYTPAPAYGLSTRLQFGGAQVPVTVPDDVVVVLVGGVLVVVVLVGGRLVVVVVVVVVGGRLVVVVVVLVGGLLNVWPPQPTPFTVKLPGAGVSEVALGWVPVQLPSKPTELTWPPVGTLPFQPRLVIDMFAPDGVKFAFQPELNVCPLGQVKVSVQDVHASPVFVMIGVAWNPPLEPPLLHAFWMSQRTLHDTAAKAGSVGSTATPPAARAPTANMAILRLEKRLKPSLMPVLLCVRVTRGEVWPGGRWQLNRAKTRRREARTAR